MPGELPGTVSPGLGARFAFLGDGVKHPAQFTRPDIERADVAPDVLLRDEGVAHRLSDHDDVPHDGRCASPAVACSLLQAGQEAHAPVVAKARNLLAGGRIERVQPLAPVRYQPPLVAVRPVSDAAVAGAAIAGGSLLVGTLHPDRLASRRVPCLDQADGVRRVEDAVDHQWGCPVGVAIAQIRDHIEDRLIDGRPRPRDAQLIDVAGIDLIERRVLGCAVVGAKHMPFAIHRPLLGGGGQGHRQCGDADEQPGGKISLQLHIVPPYRHTQRWAIIPALPRSPVARRAGA